MEVCSANLDAIQNSTCKRCGAKRRASEIGVCNVSTGKITGLNIRVTKKNSSEASSSKRRYDEGSRKICAVQLYPGQIILFVLIEISACEIPFAGGVTREHFFK